MQTATDGKFSFKVPEGHPESGKKIKTFSYDVCENDSEANDKLAEKKTTVLELVNDWLKTNARSNSYQTALAAYKPSDKSPEEMKEIMVRDFMRTGFSEEMARQIVDNALAMKDQTS